MPDDDHTKLTNFSERCIMRAEPLANMSCAKHNYHLVSSLAKKGKKKSINNDKKVNKLINIKAKKEENDRKIYIDR